MTIRDKIRHGLLNGLALRDALLNSQASVPSKKIVQVINLHHMYDYETDSFRRFLEWFSETYCVVSYAEAVDRIQRGKIDKAYGAITFDDGLKSNVVAGEILKEFGISATFFVCPEIIGENDPRLLREFCVRSRMSYESDEFVNWSEIEKLKDQNHEIGNHTYGHLELARLSIPEVTEEILKAQKVLVDRLGETKHFSWPFGRFDNLGVQAAAVVRDAGFRSVASGERGSHGPSSAEPEDACQQLICVRRDNLEARWPLAHLKYFLCRNSNRPVSRMQWWPLDWNLNPEVKR